MPTPPFLTASSTAPAPTDPQDAHLLVRVVDDRGGYEPAAWAEAVDCPGFRPLVSEEPEWLAYRALPGACSLRAVRPDGLFRTVGPAVRVQAAQGAEVRVELTVPSIRTGGVHFAFRPTEHGLQLLWVPPDTPISAAGLAPDDVLVAVNGQPVVDLAKEDLEELLVGPEGSELVLEVLRADADTDEAPELISVLREVVEPP